MGWGVGGYLIRDYSSLLVVEEGGGVMYLTSKLWSERFSRLRDHRRRISLVYKINMYTYPKSTFIIFISETNKSLGEVYFTITHIPQEFKTRIVSQ